MIQKSPGGNRDIVVIGASAGGLEALEAMVSRLPADLPAAVFVVLHMGASSHLASILGRMTRLTVSQAENGEHFARGRIYVAVPGRHLLVHEGHILLRRGARENLTRPAIDPLFRSNGGARHAAATWWGRSGASTALSSWWLNSPSMARFSTSILPGSSAIRSPARSRRAVCRSPS